MKLDSCLHNTALYETVEWIALSLGILTLGTVIIFHYHEFKTRLLGTLLLDLTTCGQTEINTEVRVHLKHYTYTLFTPCLVD